jgi:hypothetical protein
MGIIVLLPRAIRRELARVGASDLSLENLGDGYALLRGDVGGELFRWQGKARVALDRLRRLPDGAGAEAIVSEFAGG